MENKTLCSECNDTHEVEVTELVMEDNDPATRRLEGTGRMIPCPLCSDSEEADFSGSSNEDR